MESHLEARLWNDVFCVSQDLLRLPRGTVRATVLIETILAAFEMEEILFELREHSSGLNCGRWDYIFSFIKKFRNRPDMVLPDRSAVTMVRGKGGPFFWFGFVFVFRFRAALSRVHSQNCFAPHNQTDQNTQKQNNRPRPS